MKDIILFSVCFAVAAACTSSNETSSPKKENIEVKETAYGPEKVDIEKAISVKEMLTSYKGKTEPTYFTFEGKIEDVCSKAGCWVNVEKPNGETFMVRFKDHFTIPVDTEIGTHAYMSGTAYWDTVSVEMLQHFAEDAGKSEEEIATITEPQYELGFEADGILLK